MDFLYPLFRFLLSIVVSPLKSYSLSMYIPYIIFLLNKVKCFLFF